VLEKTSRPQWIATPEDLREMAGKCREQGRFALDTEADSMHSYFHKTCLIQVTTGQEDFIIDPLHLGPEDLEALWEILADPFITVMMHGSDYDMRVLDRDFGVHIKALIDTQEMALILGEEKTGLSALLGKEFGIVLDKKYQRADWGRRPLSPEMIAYAAADTRHLEALVDRLRQRLIEKSRLKWAEEEFRRLESVRHVEKEVDSCAFEKVKGGTRLGGRSRNRLYGLFQWRDQEARRRNVPPFKILGNQALVTLASHEGEFRPELLGSLPGLSPRVLQRWSRVLLPILRHPPEAPPRIRKHHDAVLTSSQRRRFQALAARRNQIADQLGIQEGLLCPKALLLALSTSEEHPVTAEDLRLSGLKGWRFEVLGQAFLKAF